MLHAGGLPLEFPAIALGENLMKPTAMLFRNLMSMDVEECIRAYPFDAVVPGGPLRYVGTTRALTEDLSRAGCSLGPSNTPHLAAASTAAEE